MLFTVLKRSKKKWDSHLSIVESARVTLVSLETRQVTDLLAGSHPQYSLTGQSSTARMVRCGPWRSTGPMALEGDPSWSCRVFSPSCSMVRISVSPANGSLVYVSGARVGLERTLVWVDWRGRRCPSLSHPADTTTRASHPMGRGWSSISARRPGVTSGSTTCARGTGLRLTTSPTVTSSPSGRPDGERVVFGTYFRSGEGLFWKVG